MGSGVGQTTERAGRCGRVLRHPVFVVAVGVLLLNDRWWKAAAPGLVTGKASDLAGVVVAAVLLSVALVFVGVGERRAAVGSSVAIGLAFVVMKRTTTGATLAEAAWGWLNEGSNRVVVDPGDLVALVMLPVVPWVWAGAAAPVPRGAVRSGARMLATIVVLGAGLTATTATSCVPSPGVEAVVPGEGGLVLARLDGKTVAWSADQGETWTSTTLADISATTSEPDPALGPSFADADADADATTVPQPPSDLVAPTEACIDQRCWRVVDGAVVRDDRPDHVEFAALDQDSTGCGASREVTSLIDLDRLDGPVLVASVGTQGIAVSSGDGRWERMPIAGTVLPAAPQQSKAGMYGGLAVGLVAAAAALAWFVPIRPTQQRYRKRSGGARAKVATAVAFTVVGVVGIAGFGVTDGTDPFRDLIGVGFRLAGWASILLALPFAYSGSREFRFPAPAPGART